MKDLTTWFSLYGESHRHPLNQAIHRVAVPGIYLCSIGLLRELPWAPARLDWALLMAIPVLLFYLYLSFRLFLGMGLLTAAGLWSWQQLGAGGYAWPLALLLFALFWVAQFIGHRHEGRRPAFLTDLQFLLIGPLWVLAGLYRRLHIPY
ncbi:hypothetical protein ATO46_11215 [Aeromonas schubertii]|uniref:Mpo1 family 2-hydroxy fatty acid dioxygenase n=1 Tax=Aeromonas schubertii TaxID=652 RepID=UPI00067F65FF|nr:Mpo1-like protein [Aeromonas schubertii]KUE78254.1 hypothetical protein ATO46_11215 [Aeromonas schubertii]MBZ6073727.1 DUF962 domain-containing protein [Aeromonas schubertii]